MVWNAWLNLISYQKRHIQSLGRPFVFQIEATNYCNLRCPMCPHDLMTRDVGYMDFELYRQVVDQVKGYSSFLRLHNMGESLFHKEIDEFIRYARINGLKSILSTNASVLTEKAAARILDAELDQLLISFDGSTKETYETCRKNANYQSVLTNIERFLEMRKQRNGSKPSVTMSLIDMPATNADIVAFKQYWEKRVDAVRIKLAGTWDGSSERINTMVQSDINPSTRLPCAWLWFAIVILWDGRVVPCCIDYDAKAVLGYLQEQSLEEIFNGVSMQALRRLHLEDRVSESSLCHGCSSLLRLNHPALPAIATIGYLAHRLGKFAKRVTSL